MNNQEVIDIYDENKNKTGKTKLRHKDTLEAGEYTIGVQAIIINSNKQILITQRSKLKELAPLKWECNGGALLSGEDIIEGLVREIYEEVGIKLQNDKAIFLKTAKNNHNFKEIYLFEEDVEISQLEFKDGEVEAAKWVNIDEFMNMFNNGEIIQNVNFDDRDYEKCLILLKLEENKKI